MRCRQYRNMSLICPKLTCPLSEQFTTPDDCCNFCPSECYWPTFSPSFQRSISKQEFSTISERFDAEIKVSRFPKYLRVFLHFAIACLFARFRIELFAGDGSCWPSRFFAPVLPTTHVFVESCASFIETGARSLSLSLAPHWTALFLFHVPAPLCVEGEKGSSREKIKENAKLSGQVKDCSHNGEPFPRLVQHLRWILGAENTRVALISISASLRPAFVVSCPFPLSLSPSFLSLFFIY